MTVTALLYIWALSVFLFWIAVLYVTHRGWKRIGDLSGMEQEKKGPERKTVGLREQRWPLVSVIIAAKEEEKHISETVAHLLNQNYPRLEIIAVNDRSRDRTGLKLEQLKEWSRRDMNSSIPLHVIHITQQWLGKNHALYQGYLKARGSYLLFTDGDVRMSPDTIRKAVQLAEQEQVDHVTLMPNMVAAGFWLRAFVHYFLFSLMLVLRPWLCNDDLNSRYGMGIGAFNLIRRSAYEKLGTHRAFAMYPDDDLELGRRVKKERLKQRVLAAASDVQVEWYCSLGEAVRGLEKNLFSGFAYKLSLLWLASAGQLLFFFAPFVVWPFVPPGASLLFLASSAAFMLAYAHACHRFASRWNIAECLLLPLSCAILIGVMIRSAYLVLKRGGIYWRGTFYPLSDLKRFR
jgi:glycosyltransferase involved in cell wall biosynthesis